MLLSFVYQQQHPVLCLSFKNTYLITLVSWHAGLSSVYEWPSSASSGWGGIDPRDAVAEPGGEHREVWEVAVSPGVGCGWDQDIPFLCRATHHPLPCFLLALSCPVNPVRKQNCHWATDSANSKHLGYGFLYTSNVQKIRAHQPLRAEGKFKDRVEQG